MKPAIVILGLVGAVFTLSLTGDLPGLYGLLALAALPVACVGLAIADAGAGRAGDGPGAGCSALARSRRAWRP